jgi:hypothetical protein
MSLAISTASLWATVLSITFPILLGTLGEVGSFALYAFLNVVAWVLCWVFVRETKGIELEKMDAVFASSVRSFTQEMWSSGPRTWLQARRLRAGWKEVAQDDNDNT